MSRKGYRRQLGLPAYGLYESERLVASIRAENVYEAREQFRKAGMVGERVRRIPAK